MSKILCVVSLIALVVGAPKSVSNRQTVIGQITSNGYAAEEHQAITEDGYIITMQRLPYSRYQTSGPADRPVVLLMHGLYSAAFAFLVMGPEYSIGYNLVDAGFDVWLGNARGNLHSRAHTTFDPDHPDDHMKFFDFSWEEIGMYDLPAMIDYILEHTGQEQLHYIGHSQGGTVFLVMASMRPEYNQKMATVHLLAGVGYMNYFPNAPLIELALISDFIYTIALSAGLVEVNSDFFEIIEGIIPGSGYTRADLCFGDIKHKDMCHLIGAQYFLRDDIIPNETSGTGGGSIKQIAHYGQNIRDKQFRRFDYGSNNQELYGSSVPPSYDLGLITSNVTMHYTVSDDLLDERDVLDMVADMPRTVARKVARESFSHSDFAVATDAKELVTDYIIEVIIYEHNRDKSDDEDIPPTPTAAPPTGGENQTPAPGAASISTINWILYLYLVICTFYVSL